MGWTAGHLKGPFTAQAAIAFDLGDDFASRVIDAARFGNVIYAAVRSRDGHAIFGLVVLTERRNGLLYTKSITEEMGPAASDCPARILDLLTDADTENALNWRERCRARLSQPKPQKGQTVVFSEPLHFENDEKHRVLIFLGGSRFRSKAGTVFEIPGWRSLDYAVDESSGAKATCEGEDASTAT